MSQIIPAFVILKGNNRRIIMLVTHNAQREPNLFVFYAVSASEAIARQTHYYYCLAGGGGGARHRL